MPAAGAPARADQLATLTRLAFERFTADEIGEPARRARGLGRVARLRLGRGKPDPVDAARLRQGEPRAASSCAPRWRGPGRSAEPVWREARRTSDFALFRRYLEQDVELKKRYIDCFQPVDEPYDALLDDFEPGVKTAEVRAVFDELKAGLVPLVAAIAERADAVDDSALAGDFPVERAGAGRGRDLHGSASSTRSGASTRPCIRSRPRVGPHDVRLTTNHHADDLTSLFACMHEFGHGLYEYQVDRALYRTPLGRGASLGVHESQSRMWENMIGRSLPVLGALLPAARRRVPGALGGLDAEAFYRAVNRVRPSLIRIDADEVTYNLHIILRFELEQELVSGRLAAGGRCSEAWDAQIRSTSAIDVPDVADGVLQDMHWSGGGDRLLPDLRARQRHLRAALGADRP